MWQALLKTLQLHRALALAACQFIDAEVLFSRMPNITKKQRDSLRGMIKAKTEVLGGPAGGDEARIHNMKSKVPGDDEATRHFWRFISKSLLSLGFFVSYLLLCLAFQGVFTYFAIAEG